MAAVLSLVVLVLSCALVSAFDGSVVGNLTGTNICQTLPTEGEALNPSCGFDRNTLFLTYGNAEALRPGLQDLARSLAVLNVLGAGLAKSQNLAWTKKCNEAFTKYWCKTAVPVCNAAKTSTLVTATAECSAVSTACGATLYAALQVVGICKAAQYPTTISSCVPSDNIANDINAQFAECKAAASGKNIPSGYATLIRSTATIGSFLSAGFAELARTQTASVSVGSNCARDVSETMCTPATTCSSDGKTIVDTRSSSRCVAAFRCFGPAGLGSYNITLDKFCPGVSAQSSASTVALSASTFLAAVIYMVCKNLLF